MTRRPHIGGRSKQIVRDGDVVQRFGDRFLRPLMLDLNPAADAIQKSAFLDD